MTHHAKQPEVGDPGYAKNFSFVDCKYGNRHCCNQFLPVQMTSIGSLRADRAVNQEYGCYDRNCDFMLEERSLEQFLFTTNEPFLTNQLRFDQFCVYTPQLAIDPNIFLLLVHFRFNTHIIIYSLRLMRRMSKIMSTLSTIAYHNSAGGNASLI